MNIRIASGGEWILPPNTYCHDLFLSGYAAMVYALHNIAEVIGLYTGSYMHYYDLSLQHVQCILPQYGVCVTVHHMHNSREGKKAIQLITLCSTVITLMVRIYNMYNLVYISIYISLCKSLCKVTRFT